MAAQMLLRYSQSPEVHAAPTEKFNENLAEANFAESINKHLYFK